MKYKLIVADTTNPAYSKMSAQVAQAIAAGFGFHNSHYEPDRNQVLVFDLNTKVVSVRDRDNCNDCEVTHTFTPDYLLNAFQSPELMAVRMTDGKYDATIFDDTITFRSSTSKLVGTVTVPKTFIRKALGASKGLPVVVFHYPDSEQTYNTLLRRVKVTRMDNDYVWGFELERGNRIQTGDVLKKYNLSRIPNGGHVYLQDFYQEPQE